MKNIQLESQQKRSDRFGLKLFLVVLLITAVVFAWSSLQYRQHNQDRDTWVDKENKLHVLGITLGESSLRQAEVALQSRSDVALYIYPLENPKAGMKLEAYFPAIADHTEVILLLDATPELLQEMQQRATMPHIYPNLVARSNLAPSDQLVSQQLHVRELTLLPSITITPKILSARFGKPTSISKLKDGKVIFTFPAIGLNATLNKGDRAQLHFSNPQQNASIL